MGLPGDYAERVYAGVLGKIIGVYLGRPIEGWSYERIMAELGEVEYYVHERRNVPLVVTDDDISGTFTFLRALPDYDYTPDLTPAQIGQTWLNYLIEKRTVLWWGGMGHSTEHTAYLRLKHGIPAPESGSIATNGKVVAEQIGAQIFIDGWGMIAPGDPERAADYARRAASVSHDGEAIYGAQVVAALEAQAFVEPGIDRLLDTAVGLIPKASIIYRMIHDLREWRAGESDWHKNRERLAAEYGYDKYGGNCHMVPNHGLIILALLHGDGDFQKSLTIANTSGWDTDCNSGNVGCLLGIRNGLSGLDAGPDWRGPVADRMYLPTADGGRAITDAVQETYRIVNIARRLAGEPPLELKEGARYHFSLPGSLQGFRAEESPECRAVLNLENREGELAFCYRGLATGRAARAATATFIPPEAALMAGYALIASPTLYPGQTVTARVRAEQENDRQVAARLYLRYYDPNDQAVRLEGPSVSLAPKAAGTLEWKIPSTGGRPIAEIGLEITSEQRAEGVVRLDHLTWTGTPELTLERLTSGTMWKRAWVDAADHFEVTPTRLRLIQDEGTGLIIQGTREWRDYRMSAEFVPHLVEEAGVAVRVQGLRRYYALLLARDGTIRLIKERDGRHVLAEKPLRWSFDEPHTLAIDVCGSRIRGFLDGQAVLEATDMDQSLIDGAIAIVCREGSLEVGTVTLAPT